MNRTRVIILLTLTLLSLSACGTIENSETRPITEEAVTEETDSGAMIPMVMVDDIVYLTTGLESNADGRCGVMDGKITSTVDGSKRPTENDQSNFGIGYEYQYGAVEGTIELYLDEHWIVFATEDVRQQFAEPLAPTAQLPLVLDETIIFRGKEYKKEELSEETMRWLELDYKERMLSSYYPEEFID